MCSIAFSAVPENKANVLFLVIDDLNTWLLSDPDRYTGRVIAPNLLRLAESGVNFRNAFTSSPKCSPSRTSFLSGVAPWNSGVYDNGLDVSASPALQGVPSLPKVFQQQGYYVASYGKISHGYDTGVEWNDKINHSRDPVPPVAPYNGWAKRKDGKPKESDWGRIHLPESAMNDTKYADAAIKQLRKDHRRPFFIACGLFHPHMPWYVPQKYLDMYPLDNIELPPVNPDDLDDIPEMGRQIIRQGVYDNVTSLNQYKDAVQGYLASTTYADAQIGRVLDALENSPYRDNTIVVLMSDHGFHLGEKKHWQKGTLWEEATHCLLMFRVPGVTNASQTCVRPVTLLDVYPTLMELAGLPKPPHLDGHSLVPLLNNVDAPWKKPALTAYQNHMTIRTDRYRLIRYTDEATELYDRFRDPHEWVNQTNNLEYAAIKTKLAAFLPDQNEMAPEVAKKGDEKGEKRDNKKGDKVKNGSLQTTDEGWTDLFDKQTLAGWRNPYDHGEARVVDGEIHLIADDKFFLCTEKTYSDFIFEAEIKLPEGKSNSGFMFRCHVKPNKVWGYQAEVDPTDRAWSGGLFDEARRKWLHPQKPNDSPSGEMFRKKTKGSFKRYDWNKYRIQAEGVRLRIWVNGTLCTDYTDDMDAEGYIGLQHHGEDGQIYRFRNIRIKEL